MNISNHEFVWWLREPVCGSEACERGSKIHGTPLGHPDYVAHQLQSIWTHQQTLLNRIPAFRDVQSAWALLLHCGAAHANYFLRVIPLDRSQRYAADHDEVLWKCLCAVSDIPKDPCTITAREASSLPMALGGIGLRSAVRTSMAAYWASWEETWKMISQRHPGVADVVVHELEGRSTSLHLSSAADAAMQLARLQGLEVPTWTELVAGKESTSAKHRGSGTGCPCGRVAARGRCTVAVALPGSVECLDTLPE